MTGNVNPDDNNDRVDDALTFHWDAMQNCLDVTIGQKLRSSDVEAFTAALPETARGVTLRLTCASGMFERAMIALVKHLNRSLAITRIEMDRCGINDTLTRRFIKDLSDSTALREVVLSNNNITSFTAFTIKSELMHLPLTSVDLSGNTIVDSHLKAVRDVLAAKIESTEAASALTITPEAR